MIIPEQFQVSISKDKLAMRCLLRMGAPPTPSGPLGGTRALISSGQTMGKEFAQRFATAISDLFAVLKNLTDPVAL